jgi:hypothetical protein
MSYNVLESLQKYICKTLTSPIEQVAIGMEIGDATPT